MKLIAAAIALSLAAPVAAQSMPASEFEAFSAGRTLYFNLDGQPFGAEQYLSGRRTLWRFAEGRCADGVWSAENDLICFRYDGEQTAQCWDFRKQGAGLRAVLVENGAETSFALEFSHADERPLNCPGPDIGS